MIIKRNIADQVFEELKKNIETGVWKEGENIPSEIKLTEIYGVSRVSVRNAIQRLVSLGWLETQQGKRTMVKTKQVQDIFNEDIPVFSLKDVDILKVLEFRKIIEVESAELAAKNATENNIKTLEKYLTEMEKNELDNVVFPMADYNYHVEIARASGNELIQTVVKMLGNTLIRNQNRLNDLLGSTGGLYYHRKIFEAIKSKDPVLARKLMNEHMDYNLTEVKNKI